MPVSGWRVEEILPCIADDRKIRAIYRLEGDIAGLLPYLASDKPGSSYNEEKEVVSFKYGLSIVSIASDGTVAMTQLKDEKEGEEKLRNIIEWIETVESRKDKIDPGAYTRREKTSAVDLIRYLPLTNCGKCGWPTCLAYALNLVNGNAEIADCPWLDEPENATSLIRIKELLGLS